MRTVSRRPLLAVSAALLSAAILGATVALAPARGDKPHAHDHEGKPHKSSGWEVPEKARQVANPVAATEESVARGKAIFVASCASCHGEKGRGDGKQAKALTKKPADLVAHLPHHSDGEIFWKISEGRRPMPAFKKDLKPEQRWDVVNYLRQVIQRPAAADSAAAPAAERATGKAAADVPE